jgi:hypothetical protein
MSATPFSISLYGIVRGSKRPALERMVIVVLRGHDRVWAI